MRRNIWLKEKPQQKGDKIQNYNKTCIKTFGLIDNTHWKKFTATAHDYVTIKLILCRMDVSEHIVLFHNS